MLILGKEYSAWRNVSAEVFPFGSSPIGIPLKSLSDSLGPSFAFKSSKEVGRHQSISIVDQEL